MKLHHYLILFSSASSIFFASVQIHANEHEKHLPNSAFYDGTYAKKAISMYHYYYKRYHMAKSWFMVLGPSVVLTPAACKLFGYARSIRGKREIYVLLEAALLTKPSKKARAKLDRFWKKGLVKKHYDRVFKKEEMIACLRAYALISVQNKAIFKKEFPADSPAALARMLFGDKEKALSI